MSIHDWTRVPAGIFHHFHHEWISSISRSLNSGILPSEYYALAEQVAGGLGPDVLALRLPETQQKVSSAGDTVESDDDGGVVSLAVSPPKVRFTASDESEAYVHQRKRIAVRHVSDHDVIAMIEIVSPGNKGSRHALRSFVDKSIELLKADIHLLIIDLFPPGVRDPDGIHGAIWAEMFDGRFQLPVKQPLTLVSYSAGIPKRAFIEPVAVGEVLPDMALFIKPQDYVSLPLHGTYDAAFNAVPPFWQGKLVN